MTLSTSMILNAGRLSVRRMVAAAALALLVFPFAPACACSCPTRSADLEFDEQTHVFLAFIQSVEDMDQAPFRERFHATEVLSEDEEGLRATFETVLTIKGDPTVLNGLRLPASSCRGELMPGELVLVATDDTGYFGYCSLRLDINVADCRHVHLIDRMQRRAKDGETTLEWSSLTGRPDDYMVMDGGSALLDAGIIPFEATPEECPIQ